MKNDFLTNLAKQAEANPMVALGAVGAFLAGFGKATNSLSAAAGRRTHAKEIKRRIRNDRRKS